MELLVSIALGLSLAATCGLRAFLPLLVTGLAARLGGDWLPLSESFTWLGSTPALIALGVAVAAETIADKVPVFDHALDVIQAPVRTLAGALVAAAVVTELPGWATAMFALVAGGGAALSVHGVKSLTRVGSTAATGGLANPVLSLAEDFAALLTAALSILLWFVALLVAVLVLVGGLWLAVTLLRRRRRAAAAAA